MQNNDTWTLGGHTFTSRFILGSGKYNLNLIRAAVEDAGAEIITLALRRVNTRKEENILDYIPEGVTLLPNTSGARNAEEAVRLARLAREMGCGDFVKVEIMHDSKYLLPDNYETIKATEILAKEGFIVMPYMYPDLNAARDMVNAGAACIMPLASPIGSNKGLATMKLIFQLLWMPVSVVRHRHVKPWKWAQQRSWPILPLQLQAISRLWQALLRTPSQQAVPLTFQVLAVSFTEAPLHLIL